MPFRFLIISFCIFFTDSDIYHEYLKPIAHVVYQSVTSASHEYGVGLLAATTLTSVPVIIALLLNRSIVWRMFFTKKSNVAVQWEWLVICNWISSAIFTLSMTQIMSTGGLSNLRRLMATNQNENRLAVILAFVSVSYLVGFFGVSFIVHDVSSASSREKEAPTSLTAFVPPAYYLSVVAFTWQIDTSLMVRATICGVTMILVGAVNLSYQVKHAMEIKSLLDGEKSQASALKRKTVSSRSGGDCTAPPTVGKYSKYYTPEVLVTKMWWSQLWYDLLMYCFPLSVAGIALPGLQPAIHVMVLAMTLFLPCYAAITGHLFMQPSKPENPSVAASRLKSYPFEGTFVNGWFRLVDSEELLVGQVKYVTACGRHFAVFRGEDAQVKCIDAHCVHLGCNMAIGGTVLDNCLRCPFHSWTFNGDGHCTHIPYQEVIPPQAHTRAYHVCEYYGMIMVWYHAQDKAPDYYLPRHEKIARGDMALKGHVSTCVNMHLNEFAENSSDFMHFDPLHGRMAIPFTQITIPGVTVNHKPGWHEGSGAESHMCWFSDDADLSLFGVKYPQTAASAVITFIGPAGLVFFTFDTPIGRIILFQTHTPLEPLKLRTAFRWYADSSMPRLLVWYIVGNWIAQWQNDISVWENKMFAGKPMLVRGDGPMMRQRRWFRQFYTDGSAAPGYSCLSADELDSNQEAAATAGSSSASASVGNKAINGAAACGSQQVDW